MTVFNVQHTTTKRGAKMVSLIILLPACTHSIEQRADKLQQRVVFRAVTAGERLALI